MREEYQKWARMVTGNKYSDFATSTSSSSQNQTRVRANPGVGVQGQKAASGQNQSLLGSSLSRSSDHQSLACDYEVLARPATPVASAAFAHPKDCPILSYHLAPSHLLPQSRGINSSLAPNPGTVRVELDLMDLLLAVSLQSSWDPGRAGAGQGCSPLPWYPTPGQTRLLASHSSVFATKQEASVLGSTFLLR